MTLEEALKKIPYMKRAYFRYKFGLRYFDYSKTINTEEEFLQLIGKKSILPYYRWENTDEYRTLVAIYLQGKYGNDLLDIYNSVSEKAKKGDSKSVQTLMMLQKEIKQMAKNKISKANEDEDDGLEL